MKRTKHPIKPGSPIRFKYGGQGVVQEIKGKGTNRLVYVKFNPHELSVVQEIDLKVIPQ